MAGVRARSGAPPRHWSCRALQRHSLLSLARFRPAHYHSQVEFPRVRDGRGTHISVGSTDAVAADAAWLADARRVLAVSRGAKCRCGRFCRSGGLARQCVRAGFRGAGVGDRGVLPCPGPASGSERLSTTILSSPPGALTAATFTGCLSPVLGIPITSIPRQRNKTSVRATVAVGHNTTKPSDELPREVTLCNRGRSLSRQVTLGSSGGVVVR